MYRRLAAFESVQRCVVPVKRRAAAQQPDCATSPTRRVTKGRHSGHSDVCLSPTNAAFAGFSVRCAVHSVRRATTKCDWRQKPSRPPPKIPESLFLLLLPRRVAATEHHGNKLFEVDRPVSLMIFVSRKKRNCRERGVTRFSVPLMPMTGRWCCRGVRWGSKKARLDPYSHAWHSAVRPPSPLMRSQPRRCAHE